MFEEIISLENLLSAWENFKSGKRGSEDVLLFERHLEDNLFWLHWDLKTGAYRHGPYHQFQIFDPKHRIIHKAAVRDRVLHHAIYRQLAPKFEPMFIFDSYSCRLNKGTHAAVRRLEGFARKASWNYTRPCWALKCDVRKFFNSINHEILLKLIERKIIDAKTMKLLEDIISSFGVVDNFAKRERERVTGIPIGNLTSQLFANVYMNPFDHFVKEILRAEFYVRYTDDFILLHEDRRVLEALLPQMGNFLKGQLALDLHPGKIVFCKLTQGIDFLGYVVLPKYTKLREQTKRRMLKRFRQGNLSSEQLASYFGLLSHCEGYELGQQLRRFHAD